MGLTDNEGFLVTAQKHLAQGTLAWALSGFGYPSAPLPTTLNIASKLLSFAAALTLFLPQRPPATANTATA